MEFFDKYLYLFDYWTADLIKPFEDDFFTNARERASLISSHRKTKFIEFVKDDKTCISFLFVLGKDRNDHLKICFGLSTFINGYSHFSGDNELYLYHQKEKLKEIVSHLQEKVLEIKKILHENEGQKLRYTVGMDLFDDYPNSLEENLQSVLKTNATDYKTLKKKHEKLMTAKGVK